MENVLSARYRYCRYNKGYFWLDELIFYNAEIRGQVAYTLKVILALWLINL